jgi:hypothetical protein
LSFPRKLEFGQMRGQRQSGMAVLLAFGVQIVLGGISALILLTDRWTGNPWLPAEAFAGLATVALGGYLGSLDALSPRREKERNPDRSLLPLKALSQHILAILGCASQFLSVGGLKP